MKWNEKPASVANSTSALTDSVDSLPTAESPW